MDSQRHLAELLADRRGLLDIVVTGVGIALGVNVFSAGAIAPASNGAILIMAIGAGLALASILYFAAKSLTRLTREQHMVGCIYFDDKFSDPIAVPIYNLSEQTTRYMRALFAENPAIENIWKSNPISSIGVDNMEESPQRRIIVEALEYYVLDKMSTHLTDYFDGIDEHSIVSFERTDIPSGLLANRFLELFSRPMEDREVFAAMKTSKGRWVHVTDGAGRIHSAIGPGGEIFDLFIMKLPKKSKISREKLGHIKISTARMDIDIIVDFAGFGGSPVRHFETLYLGRDMHSARSFKCEITTKVRFKILSVMTASGWDYYKWIDSLLSSLNSGSNFQTFLDDCGWNQAVTSAMIDKNLMKLRNAASKIPTSEPSAKPVEKPARKTPQRRTPAKPH